MDPTVTLRELREAIIELGKPGVTVGPAVNIVIERWSALDTWLSSGGFPPAQWGNLTTRDAEIRCESEDDVRVVDPPFEPSPWNTHASLSALNGAISAGEAASRKPRGDA